MPISLKVENQIHDVIRLITKPITELRTFCVKLPESNLLRGIDPWGDTYFNEVQLRYVLAELPALSEKYPEHEEMLQVIGEAAEEAIMARGYLKFVGD